MIPSISIRIENVLKAMEMVVVPAIEEKSSMAQEQAGLIIRHLKLIRGEWDKTLIFERQCYQGIRGLAENLIRDGSGGPRTTVALDNLARNVGRCEIDPGNAIEVVNQSYCTIGDGIELLIEAVYIDADPDYKKYLSRETLIFGSSQSFRERCWFQANGMDPDAAELKSVEHMFSV